MIDDFDLIVASFTTQYGLRIADIKEMKWSEFRSLLVGIGPDTILGRIVAIRAEDDKDMLKNFTAEQRKIRSDWRNRNVKQMDKRGISINFKKGGFMSDNKDYYEKEERRIVKNATEKGVPFETAAIISRNIRQEGLRDYEYLQMLKGKLSDEINRKK